MCDRYQTGALTPVIRWLSRGMQRAAAPPHPARPAARAENVPAPRQEGDNAAPAGMICTFYACGLHVHFWESLVILAYVICNIIWKPCKLVRFILFCYTLFINFL